MTPAASYGLCTKMMERSTFIVDRRSSPSYAPLTAIAGPTAKKLLKRLWNTGHDPLAVPGPERETLNPDSPSLTKTEPTTPHGEHP